MMDMSSLKLLLPEVYVSELVASIDSAKYRINLMSLVINEDESTKELIDALVRASQRGIKVSIGMDLYFTFKEIGATASRWSYLRSQVSKMRATRKRLIKAGASVRWLGQFGLTLVSSRTHLKWSIVDDDTYCFGGVNLYSLGVANNDYMFKSTNSRLAERLSAEHELVLSTDKALRAYPSHSFEADHGRVLVDGGYMLDSIIYKRVIKLAKQAKSIVYVSQYTPTGQLGRVLKQKKTKLYFNNWRYTDDILNVIMLRLGSSLQGLESSYKHRQYLHAKFMIFYMLDGQRVAISGSHNFVRLGVITGTREVALETKDSDTIDQLEEFFEKHIK